MPVTKTARRALRGSKNKAEVNKLLIKRLEIAIRLAKKSKNQGKVVEAMSLADRASKKGIFHKNKSARIKSQLSRLISGSKTSKTTKTSTKKVSSK